MLQVRRQIFLSLCLGNSLQFSKRSALETHGPENATLFLDQGPGCITFCDLFNEYQSAFQ